MLTAALTHINQFPYCSRLPVGYR